MTPRIVLSRTGKIQIKLITPLACLLILAIIFFIVGQVSANAAPASGPHPLQQRDPVPAQVATDEDASLSDINVTANGEPVTLVPPFDPGATLYTATVDAESVSVSASAAATGAGIDRTIVGDDTADLDPPGSPVTTEADLAEGAITIVSLRVRAADEATTKTYRIFLSRPADSAIPDVAIEAETAEYTAGLGALFFTLTREGPTTDSLEVTVNFNQDQPWLSDTSTTATFAAGDEETALAIVAARFSSSVTESGVLIATASPAAGYDVSGAMAQVRVISQEGPAVTVELEHFAYTFAENAGAVNIVLVARAHSSVPRVGVFDVNLLSDGQTAVSDPESPDYTAVSAQTRFKASDFQLENGALVGRKTISITILEDDLIEGDEIFHLHLGRPAGLTPEVVILDPDGNLCAAECPSPYVVTITDDDPSVTVSFGQAAYTVVEGSAQDIIVTLSDDPQRTVVIPVTITDQGGATGDDYSGVPESVTFNTGETSKTIHFAAAADTVDDDGESVMLCFCSSLPPGVTEGSTKETIITIERKLTADTEKPGISVPECESNGILVFWHAGIEFQDEPPPYGWRVERRHLGDGAWVTTHFNFLGAAADALQTHNDEFWDWTDTTRRLGVDYTYRVHALDNDGELMEERAWSRRAATICR